LNDEKFKEIFGLLYSVSQSLDMFTKYCVTEIFESRILSVDKMYRSRGLAAKLLDKSKDIAINAGFKVIVDIYIKQYLLFDQVFSFKNTINLITGMERGWDQLVLTKNFDKTRI
jgi:GNAT superfamily N-acetyltransferase